MKLFIHRSGRTARAGQKGQSYSLVTPGEAAYLYDLSVYVGKKYIDTEEPEHLADNNIISFGKIP